MIKQSVALPYLRGLGLLVEDPLFFIPFFFSSASLNIQYRANELVANLRLFLDFILPKFLHNEPKLPRGAV
jgi:hypothetical protein